MDRVRSFTPSSGAYQNEADTYEPDPANSCWGKTKYGERIDQDQAKARSGQPIIMLQVS